MVDRLVDPNSYNGAVNYGYRLVGRRRFESAYPYWSHPGKPVGF
jgi:hypothetical protein